MSEQLIMPFLTPKDSKVRVCNWMELNYLRVIEQIFPQIRGHGSGFVLFALFEDFSL